MPSYLLRAVREQGQPPHSHRTRTHTPQVTPTTSTATPSRRSAGGIQESPWGWAPGRVRAPWGIPGPKVRPPFASWPGMLKDSLGDVPRDEYGRPAALACNMVPSRPVANLHGVTQVTQRPHPRQPCLPPPPTTTQEPPSTAMANRLGHVVGMAACHIPSLPYCAQIGRRMCYSIPLPARRFRVGQQEQMRGGGEHDDATPNTILPQAQVELVGGQRIENLRSPTSFVQGRHT